MFYTILALLACSVPLQVQAAKPTTTSMFNPDPSAKNLELSVITAGPMATTYSFKQSNDASGTIVSGASTFSLDVMKEAKVSCNLSRSKGGPDAKIAAATCTTEVDKKSSNVATSTGSKIVHVPVTITAGQEKLAAQTATSSSPATSNRVSYSGFNSHTITTVACLLASLTFALGIFL